MYNLTLKDLIEINKVVCEYSGEPHNILKKDSLLSALSVFDNNYYESDMEMCSAFLRSLVLGHGFEQGNKRTAFISISILLCPLCSPNLLTSIILNIAKGDLKDLKEITYLLYGEQS